MAKKKMTELVTEELGQFLEDNGYELYHVEFVKEGKDWFLRVYIDKMPDGEETYIGIDDCEKVSRFLSERLDQLDPVEQNYYLEVSSPGMDRELLKEADYRRFAGKPAEVRLYRAINGQKKIEGILEGLIDGNVVMIDEKNQRWELPLEQVAKTRLAVMF